MLKNYLEFKEKLTELFEKRLFASIKEVLENTLPADIAQYCSESDEKQVLLLFKIMPKDTSAEVFSYLDSNLQEQIFTNASDRQINEILEELSTDDAADALSEMPANLVKRVLKTANSQTRGRINKFLNYPDNVVGSIMTSEYTTLGSKMTVEEAIGYIRNVAISKETVYTCYVLGERRSLIGVMELCDLLAEKDDSKPLHEIMETNVIKVLASDEKKEALRLTKKYDLNALPVVDSEDRLVGIVTVDDVVDVMEEEATKEIEQMAAVSHVDTPYLGTSVFSIVKARIPWLIILMAAGMLNGIILGRFEAAIASLPVLVTFMPMLTGTGGNCGSQTTATVIRAMSLGEIGIADFFKVLWKETRVALLVGLIFGAVNFARIYLFEANLYGLRTGLVLGISMVFTVLIAKAMGAVLPLLAKKARLDPAVVASPLITTIVDALSLIFYFGLATRLFKV